MLQPYPPSSYDHHFCLKLSVLMWLAIIYLSRALSLPAAMAVGSFAGVNSGAIAMMRSFWSAQALLPSLLAAAVVFALLRRTPGAGPPVRWIWAHGRILLALAAAIDLFDAGMALRDLDAGGEPSPWPLMAGCIDVYFLAYLLLARRVRDTFAEFPLAVADPGPPAPPADHGASG